MTALMGRHAHVGLQLFPWRNTVIATVRNVPGFGAEAVTVQVPVLENIEGHRDKFTHYLKPPGVISNCGKRFDFGELLMSPDSEMLCRAPEINRSD